MPPIPRPSNSSASSGSPNRPRRCATCKGWRTPRRIVMATQNPNGTGTQEMRATLAGVAPGVEFVFVADAAETRQGSGERRRDHRRRRHRLRRPRARRGEASCAGLRCMSAGVEACLGKPALERPGLVVTNMRAVAGPVMAEHTIALMFALSRSLAGVGRPAGDRRGLEPQLRGLTTAGTDRQDHAGRGPRRHRPRSCEARPCARA